MVDTFAEFQQQASSEKNILAIVEAAKRVVGWTLHSGSIYKVASTYQIVQSIEDSGVALTSVSSVGSVTAGKYFNDYENGYLYLRTSDSANPNGKFIALTQRFYFSNAPLSLPYDLSTGADVEWLPMIKDTSEFGVELDTGQQLGVAIEGKGQVKFHNDFTFWKDKYDKLTFENQRVFIYSYSRGLPANQAKLLFRGRVTAKTYSNTEVSFTLNDILNELRSVPELDNIEDLAGEFVADSYKLYKQRTIYGFVAGMRPTNIDQELEDGRVLTGTASCTQGSATVTGSGTQFLTDYNAGDEMRLVGAEFKGIESVDSDTQITLSEEADISLSAVAHYVKGERPKRYLNREFILAGHALREPSTTVSSSTSAKNFDVVDATDFEAGDSILVGSEVVTIDRVVGTNIVTTTNLVLPPAAATVVKRLTVTDVRLGDKTLTYSRDYTYDASGGTLSLDPLSEFNVAVAKTVTGTSVTFTNGSRDVSGIATIFDAQLKPGDWIKLDNQTEYFEILQVVSATALKLKSNATYTGTSGGNYKSPDYYSEGESVLVCNVIGKTDDGTTGGTFLKTASQIVEDLCTTAGLSSVLNSTSFSDAIALAPQKIGLMIPEKFSDTKPKSYKEYISMVNRSVFASLIQNEDFQLEYAILRPRRSVSLATKIDETDILKWSIKSASDRIVSNVNVRYQENEADPNTGESFFNLVTATTDNGTYLAKITKTYDTDTLLYNQQEAQLLANRWAFFFDTAITTINISSKLQLARLQINDIVDITHPRLYERVGSSLTRKICLVENISQDERGTTVDIVDLANAFSRVSVIMDSTASDFATATDDELAHNGFITDQYGMLNSGDAETFGANLIW